MKQIIETRAPQREFILHNPGIEPIEMCFGGETRVVPPANVVEEPDPNRKHKAYSGKDADGDWIPGTIVFKDIYEYDELSQGDRLLWDAWWAVKSLLGVDPNTQEATGPYALRGVSLIHPGATKEEIKEIAAAGRLRYEDFKVGAARAMVATHEEDNKRRAKFGQPEVPGDAAYEEALLILAGARNRQKQKLDAVLGNKTQVLEAPENAGFFAPGPSVVEPQVDEDAFNEFVKEAVAEAAAKTNVADRHAFVDKFLSDPENMKILRSRFKMVAFSTIERQKHAAKAAETRKRNKQAAAEAQ